MTVEIIFSEDNKKLRGRTQENPKKEDIAFLVEHMLHSFEEYKKGCVVVK